jgi:hypothetical protein
VPTVCVSRPKVPAAAALNGWPGCTVFAAGAAPAAPVGSALGSVPIGLAKMLVLNRLKISARSSLSAGRSFR